MRSTRLSLTALAVVFPLALVAGCSGDDEPAGSPESSAGADNGDGEGGGDGAGEDSSGDAKKQKIRTCKADVTLSGAETLTVSGKGRAIAGNNSGPAAFYELQKDDVMLGVYSEGEDFTPNVSVTVGDASYSTLQEPEGLKIAKNGKRAVVDAEASGVNPDDPGVRVVAEFTCK